MVSRCTFWNLCDLQAPISAVPTRFSLPMDLPARSHHCADLGVPRVPRRASFGSRHGYFCVNPPPPFSPMLLCYLPSCSPPCHPNLLLFVLSTLLTSLPTRRCAARPQACIRRVVAQVCLPVLPCFPPSWIGSLSCFSPPRHPNLLLLV